MMSKVIVLLALGLGIALWLWKEGKLPKAPAELFEEPSVELPKPKSNEVSLALKYYPVYQSSTIPTERKAEIVTRLEQEEQAGYRDASESEAYAEWLAGIEEYRATKETWFEKVGGIF